MCLGLTCRVTEITGEIAVVVDPDERPRRVSLLALDEPVAVGDWVLVHAGFAVARLSVAEAEFALGVARMRERPAEPERAGGNDREERER